MKRENVNMEVDMGKTTFLPGQTIHGHLAIDLPSESTLLIIRVKLLGQVVTTLMPDTGDGQQFSTITLFRETENYTESPVTLIGQHIFPFSFRVPPTSLPASFNGNYGKVVYSLNALLMELGNSKVSISIPITIPSTKDPNNPEFLHSISKSINPLFSNVSLTVEIPKKAYTCEELCPISIQVENKSGHSLLIEQVCIKQKVEYTVLGQYRSARTEKIHTIPFSEEIPSLVYNVSRLINFPIPNSPILDPDIKTSILKVTHFIQVKAKTLGSISRNLKVQLPLVIAGFSYMLFDEIFYRRDCDTLPLYPNDSVDADGTNSVDDLGIFEPSSSNVELLNSQGSSEQIESAGIVIPD